jgi:CheY-like chemotaxis protein
MPDRSGPELAAAVRSGAATVRDPQVPIVGVTADAVAEFVASCRQAGMGAVLTKPFRRRELLEAVARHARGITA